jgi:DNA-3-methyladenine glycosylase I
MRDRGEDFADWLWGINGPTLQNAWTVDSGVPGQTDKAVEMAKALKSRGFKYCGPVIVYAFMQAVGMVNDHLVTCYRHEECRAMARP